MTSAHWAHLREYLILARIQTAGVTILTGIFGALAASSAAQPTALALAALGVIGLCAHLHGFISNELADQNVDALSGELSAKPLVQGSITRRRAWIAAMLPAVIAYPIIALIFPNVWLWGLFLAGHAGEIVYNFRGKRFPGSDACLALWAFTFCLFGAWSAFLPLPWQTINFWKLPGSLPPLAWIIAALGGLQIFFNNAIEGGMKDCDHDALASARTLASYVLGARVENGRLILPRRFIVFAAALKAPALMLAALPLIFPAALDYPRQQPAQSVLYVLLSSAAVGSFIAFHRQTLFNRTGLKRLFSIHEISVTYLVPLLLWPVAGGAWAAFLCLFPLAWYLAANRTLYGTFLNPQV